MCEGIFGVNAKGECNLCGYIARKKRRAGTPGTASRERKRPKTICKKTEIKCEKMKYENEMKPVSCTNGQMSEPLSERLAIQDEIGIFLEEQGASIFQEGHGTPENYRMVDAPLGVSADMLFMPVPFENEMLSPLNIYIGDDVDNIFPANYFEDELF